MFTSRWLVLGIVLPAVAMRMAGAEPVKVPGTWTWDNHSGSCELTIDGTSIKGKFSVRYEIKPPTPGQPGAIVVGGEEFAVSGELDGKLNPQTNEVNGTVSGTWSYEGYPPGRQSPFPLGRSAPFSGSFAGNLDGNTISGTWRAEVSGESYSDYPQVPPTIAGTLGAQSASRPPQCPEGYNFYTREDLEGYYTGKPSLLFSREQLTKEMVSALQRFKSEGGTPQSGVGWLEAKDIAREMATRALPTGKEAELKAAAQAAASSGKRLSPGDLFYLALKVNGGNVKNALLTSHAVLYRDAGKKNSQFIKDTLLPMRDPEGYSEKLIKVGNQQRSVRSVVGDDQQGVWYHFFGMAAVEFSDYNGATGMAPMWAVRMGAENADGVFASLAKRIKNVPASGLGGNLADFSIALENEFRKDGSAPDPDKQCVNYSGIAAGRALAKELEPKANPAVTAYQDRRLEEYRIRGVVIEKSPLSMEIIGTSGERFAFDQRHKRFSGNTPFVLFEPLDEPDGTWGLIVAPLFPVRSIAFAGTGTGDATVGFHNLDRSTTGVYQVPITDGTTVVLEGWDSSPVLRVNGQPVEPVGAEVAAEPEDRPDAIPAPRPPAAVGAHEAARDGRLVAYDDGTVLDTESGLMWAAKDNGANIKWDAATAYCASFRAGGHSDWRMPTTAELRSIYDDSRKGYRCACRKYLPLLGAYDHVLVTPLIQLSCDWVWGGPTPMMFGFNCGEEKRGDRKFAAGMRVLPVRSTR
ncbi:MAG: DUF1566 domain-containing protein [Acidobacteriota bacterium]